MGAFLDKPKTDKTNKSGQGNGLQFGLASMQGWRVEMEDAHSAVTGLPGNLAKWSFFAVFDGHAGQKVSNHCADELLKAIVATNDFKQLDPVTAPPLDAVRTGIREGFLNLDKDMRKMPEVESGEDKSGSTAVCVLISPSHLFFANCGDSRAILVSSGRVAYSTHDHKPVNPDEKERIQNAGGSVMIQRVNGSLAVSRSLGDYDYKNTEGKGQTEQMVSPEPEIYIYDRNKIHDQYIVLACDGVWDVMTNEELCEYVNHRLKVSDDMIHVCNEVLDTCFFKGSRDNMSIVIVKLNACNTDPEMIKRDKALDATLEEFVTQTFESALSPSQKAQVGTLPSHEILDITTIYHQLSSEDFKDLPPGGGLASKRTHIESVYNQLCQKYTGTNSGTAEDDADAANQLPPSDSS